MGELEIAKMTTKYQHMSEIRSLSYCESYLLHYRWPINSSLPLQMAMLSNSID
jgi:hypothetical protein